MLEIDGTAAGEIPRSGNDDARLWHQLYQDLRRQARFLRKPHRSLETTALVHEVFLRLADTPTDSLEGPHHFVNLAARTMRQILVDRARRRSAVKRDGGVRSTREPDSLFRSEPPPEQILGVHKALDDLARRHPRHARVVELRYFAGLPLAEVATVLGISRATVNRDWTAARGWLFTELAGTT